MTFKELQQSIAPYEQKLHLDMKLDDLDALSDALAELEQYDQAIALKEFILTCAGSNWNDLVISLCDPE